MAFKVSYRGLEALTMVEAFPLQPVQGHRSIAEGHQWGEWGHIHMDEEESICNESDIT